MNLNLYTKFIPCLNTIKRNTDSFVSIFFRFKSRHHGNIRLFQILSVIITVFITDYFVYTICNRCFIVYAVSIELVINQSIICILYPRNILRCHLYTGFRVLFAIQAGCCQNLCSRCKYIYTALSVIGKIRRSTGAFHCTNNQNIPVLVLDIRPHIQIQIGISRCKAYHNSFPGCLHCQITNQRVCLTEVPVNSPGITCNLYIYTVLLCRNHVAERLYRARHTAAICSRKTDCHNLCISAYSPDSFLIPLRCNNGGTMCSAAHIGIPGIRCIFSQSIICTVFSSSKSLQCRD